MQVKNTQRYHHTLLRMVKIKILTTNADVNMQKLDYSYIAGRKVNFKVTQATVG